MAKILSKIKDIFAGGEYGRRQEERIKKTPEGRKNLEDLKKYGLIKSILNYRKKKKKWGL